MTKWQPIETAPYGVSVLLYFKIADPVFRYAVGCRAGDAWLCDGTIGPYEGECCDPPTHWMPLPEPPEDSQ